MLNVLLLAQFVSHEATVYGRDEDIYIHTQMHVHRYMYALYEMLPLSNMAANLSATSPSTVWDLTFLPAETKTLQLTLCIPKSV